MSLLKFLSSPTLSGLEQKCNIKLLNFRSLCDANRLLINPDKSAAIIIPPKLNNHMPSLNLLYDNKLIPCKELSKYLGITIDQNFNFKCHIHTTVSKLARSVERLNKLRIILAPPTLLLLYYSLILPHLLFGLPIWGSTCPTYLTKLQLQNKAIGVISNSSIKTLITPQFYKLSVLKIYQLYEFEIAKLMHQHSRGMLPSIFNSLFQKLSNKHTRQTRATTNHNLHILKYSTNRSQKSIKYQGDKLWNSLSVELRNQSFSKLKLNYKLILLNIDNILINFISYNICIAIKFDATFKRLLCLAT